MAGKQLSVLQKCGIEGKFFSLVILVHQGFHNPAQIEKKKVPAVGKKERKKEERKVQFCRLEKGELQENYTSVNIWMNYTVCAISISFTHEDAELPLPADNC